MYVSLWQLITYPDNTYPFILKIYITNDDKKLLSLVKTESDINEIISHQERGVYLELDDGRKIMSELKHYFMTRRIAWPIIHESVHTFFIRSGLAAEHNVSTRFRLLQAAQQIEHSLNFINYLA